MKIIEQEVVTDLSCCVRFGELLIEQSDDIVVVDKQGAKQLIEILKEFVNDTTRD